MRLTKPTTMNFSIGKIHLLLLTVIFFAACNNNEADSAAIADSTVKNNTAKAPQKMAIASLGDFPVLCIDTTRLKNLWADMNVRKLVFQFNNDNTLTQNPSLTVYKARPNGTFIGGAVLTLDRRDVTFNLSGEILLGNLELTRQNFMNMPNSTKAGYLLFFPTISRLDNKSVTYKLIWGDCNNLPDTEGLVAPGELNPSPPADPS